MYPSSDEQPIFSIELVVGPKLILLAIITERLRSADLARHVSLLIAYYTHWHNPLI